MKLDKRTAAELKDHIARLEHLDAELADMRKDRAGLLKDAVERGFDGKVITAILRERRELAKDGEGFAQRQTIAEVYRTVLGAMSEKDAPPLEAPPAPEEEAPPEKPRKKAAKPKLVPKPEPDPEPATKTPDVDEEGLTPIPAVFRLRPAVDD